MMVPSNNVFSKILENKRSKAVHTNIDVMELQNFCIVSLKYGLSK